MGDQASIPLVDEASGADFKRKVEAFPSIVVWRSLYLSVFLWRAALMLAEEFQGTISSTRVTSRGLVFQLTITRSGFWAVMATSGVWSHHLSSCPPGQHKALVLPALGKQEVVDNVVVAPLVSIQGFLAVAQEVAKKECRAIWRWYISFFYKSFTNVNQIVNHHNIKCHMISLIICHRSLSNDQKWPLEVSSMHTWAPQAYKRNSDFDVKRNTLLIISISS